MPNLSTCSAWILSPGNRVFMAPLTRTRADADGVPSSLAATYYSNALRLDSS